MDKQYHVYAVCNGGHDLYLQVEFSGTKKECNDIIRSRVKAGRPTHFLHVSSLGMPEAKRKFLP